MERDTRRVRNARPTTEALEGRQLLNGKAPGPGELSPAIAAQAGTRRVVYTTAQGSHVTLVVQGVGNIGGTNLGPDGSLNLVYNHTNAFTTIRGTVRGGTGAAPLESISDSNVPLTSLSGIGGHALRKVDLRQFDLVDGGVVNLTAGVGSLFLNSAGTNTQINLREGPVTPTSGRGATSDLVVGHGAIRYSTTSFTPGLGGTGQSGTTSASTTSNNSGSGLVGSGEAGAGAGSGAVVAGGATSTGTANLGTSSGGATAGTGPSGTSNTLVEDGQTLTYADEPNGGKVFLGTTGTFTAGTNQTGPLGVGQNPPASAPPGVAVSINHVRGGATGGVLGSTDVFGFDQAQNAIIRFDTITGAALQTISLAGLANTPLTGLGLARNHSELVALVGRGQTVTAFDALTGNQVGQFSTANLAASGIGVVGGIGSTDTNTVLVDPTSGPNGMAQDIDVTASLAGGSAVPIGPAFAPTREFSLATGVSGVAGSNSIFFAGAGFFDTSQPNITQQGLLAASGFGGPLRESSRTSLASPTTGRATDVTTPGVQTIPVGSVGQSLAVVTGVSNGQNRVTLYSPASGTSVGSVALDDPNPLTALTSSFNPALVDTALIDVQGDVQSFLTRDTQGLVFNDDGNFNIIKAASVSDSTFVGQPFSHVDIASRTNVTIQTPTRTVGTRSDVAVVSGLRQVGPLSLPQ